MYDADTKSLIFQGYGVVGCPILRYVVLLSNNFNYSLLVAPSFANGGNLFVLPIIFYDNWNILILSIIL